VRRFSSLPQFSLHPTAFAVHTKSPLRPRVSIVLLRVRFTAPQETAIFGLSIRFTLEVTMLWTIFVILLVLWILGLVSSYTLGGFIHILLVLAIVVLLINIISGRRTAL
jgi:hypothetical protein